MPTLDAVAIRAVGPASCAAVAWRMDGRVHVTVIVKATFLLSPGGPMTVAEPAPVLRAEVHRDNHPAHSVEATSECAPYLPAADVVLTGHACAPEGERATALAVRLAVYRGDALLDKTIHVYGDRKGAEPAPFDRIPLVYERAYGGIGWSENPLGTGFGSRKALPNLVDPADPARLACFAPVSRGWPARKLILGKIDRKNLDLPVAEIPAGFDWTYFHASPPDQRIAYLQGDEWIVLEGLDPVHQGIQSRLPDVRALARVEGVAGLGEGHRITLSADTLAIDADRLCCSVVFRQSFTVPSAEALATVRVDAGIEVHRQPIDWPAAPDALAAPAEPDVMETLDVEEAVPDEGPLEQTIALPAPAKPIVPAAPAKPIVPAAPPSAPAAPTAPPSKWEGTFALPPVEHQAAAARKPMPFVPRSGPAPGPPVRLPPAPAPPRVREAPAPDEPEREETVPLPIGADQLAQLRALPFAAKRAKTASLALDAQQVAKLREPPASPPGAARMRSLTTTLAIEEDQLLHTLPFVESEPVRVEPMPALVDILAPAPAPPAPPVVEEARPAAAPVVTVLGIQLIGDGPFAFGVVPWDQQPSRDCLTVFAKATCDLVPGLPAALRPEAEPATDEVYAEGERRRVLSHPSDRVPYKVRADVVAVGGACAPDVMLRFGAPGNAFARRLRVFGDRRWDKGLAQLRPSTPEPWRRMPITYERAYGGARFDANPDGIGHHDRMRPGPAPLPNLEDPDDLLGTPRQTRAPACFAPIPLAWKARWARLGREREGWSCLADDLDWTYYQAAPRAQQLAFLEGDEPFAITGMHAQHPVIEGTLPGVRARCFARRAPGHLEEVTLRLDTVVFDVDALKVSLVWRGALPVDDERRPGVAALYLLAEPATGPGISLAEARARLLRP